MSKVRARHGTLTCAVLSILVLLTACGHGLTDKDWTQAVADARSVNASLRAGSYDAARETWKPVDNLIHTAFPKLKKADPAVAGNLWTHMGLVEVGFLNKDYNLVEQGSGALPDLLVKAHDAWNKVR
jgi:hypothetical protein